METPVKHQSLEAEGTCVSVHEEISAGELKQHRAPKRQLVEDRAVTVQVETDKPECNLK